ncbi:unnamed protein product [Arctia plantaginis]|uniref:Uncharacterized protein n=1 Tax=Arctia plantaginis TaxID=874455 RepID=A0A8S1AH12_ARCPL|nr:unnamed protein product [Arctia plantaginis]
MQEKIQQDNSNKDYNENANDDFNYSHSLLRTLENQKNIKEAKKQHHTRTRSDNVHEDKVALQVIGKNINKESLKRYHGHKYSPENVSKVRITKRARGDSVKPEDVMTCQQLEDKCIITCAKKLEWCTEWKKTAISF